MKVGWNRLLPPILCAFSVALLAAGCVSKSKARLEQQQAFQAGQRQGMELEAKKTSVIVAGNVKNPIVPWTADMTLARAVLAADYLGPTDPADITITREGSPPIHFNPKKLLRGEDMPLKAGDQITIRP